MLWLLLDDNACQVNRAIGISIVCSNIDNLDTALSNCSYIIPGNGRNWGNRDTHSSNVRDSSGTVFNGVVEAV